MKRYFVTAMTFLGSLFLCWYGGLDFFVRGVLQAYAFFVCVACAVLMYFFPGWEQ